MQYLAFKIKPIFDKISFKVHSINDYVKAYIYSVRANLGLKFSSKKHKMLHRQHIHQMIDKWDKKFNKEK